MEGVRLPDRLTGFTFLADLPSARSALAFAAERHAGQRRDSDEAPFIIHPLEVASLLRNTGYSETIVVAAILHDTLENTSADAADLERRFGRAVAELVVALTEDPTIEPYESRKATLREQIAKAGAEAIAIYAADKVAKVREHRAQLSLDPGRVHDHDRTARREHYARSLEMLEHADDRHPLVRQLRFELEALGALPPAGLGPGETSVVLAASRDRLPSQGRQVERGGEWGDSSLANRTRSR
jgi:hypothetical protein